jgi:hypothetical protein
VASANLAESLDVVAGWPQTPVMPHLRTNGRPTAQWSCLDAGRSDELGGAAR